MLYQLVQCGHCFGHRNHLTNTIIRYAYYGRSLHIIFQLPATWSGQPKLRHLTYIYAVHRKKRNTQNPSHHTTTINHLSHQPWPYYTKNHWPPSTKWTLQNCTPCPHSAALRWAWNENKLSSLSSYKLHNIVAKRQPHHDQTRKPVIQTVWHAKIIVTAITETNALPTKSGNSKQLTPEPQKPHPKRWTAKSIQSHGTSNGKGRFAVRLYREVRRRYNPNKTC